MEYFFHGGNSEGLYPGLDTDSSRRAGTLLAVAETLGGQKMLDAAVQVVEQDPFAFVDGGAQGAMFASWTKRDTADAASVLSYTYFQRNFRLPDDDTLGFPAYAMGFMLGEEEQLRAKRGDK